MPQTKFFLHDHRKAFRADGISEIATGCRSDKNRVSPVCAARPGHQGVEGCLARAAMRSDAMTLARRARGWLVAATPVARDNASDIATQPAALGRRLARLLRKEFLQVELVVVILVIWTPLLYLVVDSWRWIGISHRVKGSKYSMASSHWAAQRTYHRRPNGRHGQGRGSGSGKAGPDYRVTPLTKGRRPHPSPHLHKPIAQARPLRPKAPRRMVRATVAVLPSEANR